ncbi:hypothetical protein TB2_008960 [Malus domestica]
MLIVVTSISSLVHLYSISYMSEDPHSPRFMCYLSILTFFMPMLVTGDNSLQLFLGWEGVGLASYLLIHFWFTRLQADKAATKAMPVNRVGDFGLAPGISGRFTLFQTVDFSTIFARASAPRNSWISCNMRFNAITLICILLFIGAVGKSAQIGLHTWSPDAMEGPTPVSASIHAATMVTAGVFMIARCSPLFEYPPTALIVITSAGATTSFLAGLFPIGRKWAYRLVKVGVEHVAHFFRGKTGSRPDRYFLSYFLVNSVEIERNSIMTSCSSLFR